MGGGLGGVSICLSRIWPDCHFTVADFDHTDIGLRTYNYGTENSFAAYNDLAATKELLMATGTKGEAINLINGLPESSYAITFSVLSWGFHYPVDTYAWWAWKRSGITILDCRANTGAKDDLSRYWDDVELIESYGKHEWYRCT